MPDPPPRRILIVGPSRWTDGASIRAGLAWMIDRYGLGNPADLILVVRGTEGFDARAATAWRSLNGHGAPPPEVHAPDHDRDGLAARDIRNRHLLEHGGVAAVLAYSIARKDIGRVMLRLARDLDVPAWRWSVSLRRPVAAGVDAHRNRHRRRGRGDRAGPDPLYDS